MNTLTTMNLREQAALAHAIVKVREQRGHELRQQEHCAKLAPELERLMKEVLGVGVEPTADTVEYDGLIFRVKAQHYDDFYGPSGDNSLFLVRPCDWPECDRAQNDLIRSIEDLGRELEDIGKPIRCRTHEHMTVMAKESSNTPTPLEALGQALQNYLYDSGYEKGESNV